MIEEGLIAILYSSDGPISCRRPLTPTEWNEVNRPHVALLLPVGSRTFRFFLSHPTNDQHLWIRDLESVPDKSVIDVRHSATDYRYYRREGKIWTMVGEARDQFFIEVFHHGSNPAILESSNKVPIGD